MKRNLTTRWLLTGLGLLSATCATLGNNVRIDNVALDPASPANRTVGVRFDITWDNSWRTTENWDAAWVFVKYKTAASNAWRHAVMATDDGAHAVASGGALKAASDGMGVFIYRTAPGTGTVQYAATRLRWDFGENGEDFARGDHVEVAVHAIEMVYVPEGAFYLGSVQFAGENGRLYQYPSTSAPYAYRVDSEGAILTATQTNALWGEGGTGTQNAVAPADPSEIPAAFPKGYGAFYCMKYEVSQGQYAAFLNKLTSAQDTGNNRYPSWFGQNRHTITGSTTNRTTTTPDRACNYLSWMDGCAYSDWSGLRPMTELEFAKACRGGGAPTANGECAWGAASVFGSAYVIANDGADNATVSNPGVGTGNASYLTTDGALDGPLRCGIFAASTSNPTRAEAGASYYGIMELSGNVWERWVSIGNTAGRAFEGSHGDGTLSPAGNADNSDWPGYADGQITGAAGSGLGGGSWQGNLASGPAVAYRYRAAQTDLDREFHYGWRAVRTAPPVAFTPACSTAYYQGGSGDGHDEDSAVVTLGFGCVTEAYSIVIPEAAQPWEEYAADTLATYVESMSGVHLSIISDTNIASSCEFIIGASNARLNAMSLNLDDFSDDSFLLKTVAQKLVIVGDDPHGVVYGVLELLEQWGVRFYNASVTKIPEYESIPFPDIDQTFVPTFKDRVVALDNIADHDLWVRHRFAGPNFAGQKQSEEHGRFYTIGWNLHSFLSLVPPSQYFASHPEYYSLRNGQRIANGQLCLTNPDLPGLVASVLTNKMSTAGPCQWFWGVAQMDNTSYCECSNCMSLAASEGSQSGPLIHFVNKVAALTSPAYPENTIVTLAYNYSENPPDYVVATDNVAVVLCPLRADRLRAMTSDATISTNRYYHDLFEGWTNHTQNLMVWDYVSNFTDFLAIHPDYSTWVTNLKLYAACGIRSVFMQGAYNTDYSEFNGLRRYVLSHLLWDLDQDVNALVQEYCEGVYGTNGAELVTDYMNAVHQIALSNNTDTVFHVELAGYNKCGLTQEVRTNWIERFEVEIAEALNDQNASELRLAMMPVLHTELATSKPNLLPFSGGLQPDREVSSRYLALIDRFEEIANEWDLGNLGSYVGTAEHFLTEISACSATHHYYTMTNSTTTMRLLPTYGGKIHDLVMPCLGLDTNVWPTLLKYHRTYLNGFYNKPGAIERYSLVEEPTNSLSRLRMASELEGDMTLERSIDFSSESSFTLSEALTNTGTEPQPGYVGVIIQFPMDIRANEQLWFLNTNGIWEAQEWFAGSYVGYFQSAFASVFSGGGWALRNSMTNCGISRLVTFDAARFNRLECSQQNGSGAVTLMMGTASMTLGVGDSVTNMLSIQYLDAEASEQIFGWVPEGSCSRARPFDTCVILR